MVNGLGVDITSVSQQQLVNFSKVKRWNICRGHWLTCGKGYDSRNFHVDHQQYLCPVLRPPSIHTDFSDPKIPYRVLSYARNQRGLRHLGTSSTAPYLSPTLVLLGPVDQGLVWELQIFLYVHRRFQSHNGHHYIRAPATNLMAVTNGPKQKTCSKWHLWDGNRVRNSNPQNQMTFTHRKKIGFVSSRLFASYTQLRRI